MSEWEPKIVAFLCNWCSYGAADLAGVGRMEYPSNIRVVRIPCTGRMDPKFFLAALRFRIMTVSSAILKYPWVKA